MITVRKILEEKKQEYASILGECVLTDDEQNQQRLTHCKKAMERLSESRDELKAQLEFLKMEKSNLFGRTRSRQNQGHSRSG